MELEENRNKVIQYAIDSFEICKKMKDIHPDKRYALMIKNASEFTKQYPVCAKYMSEGMFNRKYFELWLKKLEADPYHSQDEFFKRQADYAKGLCKWMNPRLSVKELNNIWNGTYKAMVASKKDIENKQEQVEAEIRERKLRHLNEKRKEILKFIQENK